jgi:hypothetical protein
LGRDCLISAKNEKISMDVTAKKDRANERMTMAEGVDNILEAMPKSLGSKPINPLCEPSSKSIRVQ